MNKALALKVFALCALTTLFVGFHPVQAPHTEDGRYFPLASPIKITSPSNSTYSSGLLMLNITFKLMLNVDRTNITMLYSIDGKENTTIPVSATFVPLIATRTYENGTTENGTSFFSYYIIAGTVGLPEFPKGLHNLSVYGKYERGGGSSFDVLDDCTVYFTINDGNAPVISSLSVENKTYSQDNLSLNFTVDQPISWMGYCLDEKVNVTTTGKFALSELASGSHTLTIYANDTVGNMGTSETISFSIAEPFPKAIAVASIAIIAAIIIGILPYFKKFQKE